MFPRSAPFVWQPRSSEDFRDRVRNAVLEENTIEGFSQMTLKIANEEQFWEPRPEAKELRDLFQGLRRTSDPDIRRAFQILTNAAAKRRKQLLALKDLLQRAQQKRGTRGKNQTKLKSLDHSQREARSKLETLQSRARADTSKVICDANELRDIGLSRFPNRAPGNDGLPSNVTRHLPFAVFLFLAQQLKLTQMAGDDSVEPSGKPASWWCVFVSLLAKRMEPRRSRISGRSL